MRVFDTRARVKVMAPAQEVMHHIGPTIGVIEPGDDTFCVVTIGGDHDWIARDLDRTRVAVRGDRAARGQR